LGQLRIQLDTAAIPPFGELDAERCYLAWDMVLATESAAEAIRDVFIFVEDECELLVERVPDQAAETPAAAEAPAAAETPAAAAPLPRPGVPEGRSGVVSATAPGAAARTGAGTTVGEAVGTTAGEAVGATVETDAGTGTGATAGTATPPAAGMRWSGPRRAQGLPCGL